jgi:hypothetical protein
MVWLLITLLAGLSLVLFLLAVPIDVDYNYNSREERRSVLLIVWLFGLVKVDANGQEKKQKITRPKRKFKTKQKPKRRRPKRSKEEKIRGLKRMWSALSSEGFIQHILRFILNLFRQINIRTFNLSIRFGLDDPADTGQLYGVIAPFALCLQAFPFTTIRIQPVFTGVALHTYFKIQVRIVPIRIVWVLIRFTLSLTTLRAAKEYITAR